MQTLPDSGPESVTAHASPEALADPRARLRATRWPDAPEDIGWSLGTDLAYLRDLVAYWADGFDWAAQEKALSAFPRFRARLDGLRIHYIHARAVNPAGPAAQQLFDPLWGMNDPAAGAWFPQQALQLAQDASPSLMH